MFLAIVGPTVESALLNDTHCFLENPAWKALYLSLAQGPGPHLTDRSPLVLGLRVLLIDLPGLWHDMNHALCDSDHLLLSSPSLAASLLARTEAFDARMSTWITEYKAHCLRTSLCASLPHQETDKRREVYGSFLECLLLIKRFLGVLDDTERPRHEKACQDVAHEVMLLQNQLCSPHLWLFCTYEIDVAQTVINTREEWEERTPGNFTEETVHLVKRARWEAWCAMLRAPAREALPPAEDSVTRVAHEVQGMFRPPVVNRGARDPTR